VSSLTREVERERGTGSRVTVRKKLLELVDEGLVEKAEGHDYRLFE
jgi:DNA-binding GntR family transcriptional regulator